MELGVRVGFRVRLGLAGLGCVRVVLGLRVRLGLGVSVMGWRRFGLGLGLG